MSASSPDPDEPRHDRGFSFLGGAAQSLRAHLLEPEWTLGVALGVLYVAAIVVIRRCGMLTDELDHYSQVALFLRGDFRVLTGYLTTIPGYHALVAMILRACGATSLDAARLVNAGFGLLAAAGFHALRRQVWPGTETLATAQFLALPILAPLFFIVYTDVFALALILWATWATLKQRDYLSALLLSMLVCVRQNEVVWAGFVSMLAVWPLWSEQRFQSWRLVFARGWAYLVPVIGFVGFWWWNGSISLSHDQAAMHPDFGLHAGNLFFALFVAGTLLFLQALVGLRDFAANARRYHWLLAIPMLVFAIFFWWGFHADNPYNAVVPWYYIRNGFLIAVDAQPPLRALVGVVIVVAACGLAGTRLRPPTAAWLYPIAILFLAASWLVEQRYVLVPLVLWLAFREHRGRAIEYATLALWLVLAVFFFSGMVGGRFFL